MAGSAAHDFASLGYPVMEMEGGFEVWKEKDLETEKWEALREPPAKLIFTTG